MMQIIEFRIAIVALAVLLVDSVGAQEIETFVEPYRTAALSTSETGVLEEIVVKDGNQVNRGQTLAWLNDDVLQATLKVAAASMQAKAALNIAENEVATCLTQLESYRSLRKNGNATERELERSESDYLQAEARLENVREDLAIRALEHVRVQAQIDQRQIKAPFDGIVVRVEKEVGEQVSPTDPVVLHLVQVQTLKALFSVPVAGASSLRPGHVLRLGIGNDKEARHGVIEYVSAVADAKSGTVSVTVRIPNSEGKIQSGLPCRWNLSQQDNYGKSSGIVSPRRTR
ncbi:MAG: efflux RND transporter periplasmic adaptor subunit [Rubripirellula sp.]|nr:efflux RND transporter periplasmic adaptor subunit [Rubripirellula sp.]